MTLTAEPIYKVIADADKSDPKATNDEGVYLNLKDAQWAVRSFKTNGIRARLFTGTTEWREL